MGLGREAGGGGQRPFWLSEVRVRNGSSYTCLKKEGSHHKLKQSFTPAPRKRPLPSTTCFSTKTRPFPIPLPLIDFQTTLSQKFPVFIFLNSNPGYQSILRCTPMKMERIESSETSGDYPLNARRKFEIKIFKVCFLVCSQLEFHQRITICM